MFRRVLVANRGEIARRIFRTLRALGIESVAIHSSIEELAAHVAEAGMAIEIAASHPSRAYLHLHEVIAAAKASGADAIHPGYGFLSENADFAQAVTDAGMVWIGPSAASIRLLGDKAAARREMARLGFPVARGGEVSTAAEAVALGRIIGMPLMLKAVAGGGGIGMQVVTDISQLAAAAEKVSAHAERFFGSSALLVERYLGQARHIELQVAGFADGIVHVLGDRDCSVQRRFQKVVEEAPAANLSDALRQRMHRAAESALSSLGYRNLGTVECLVDGEDFVFLEVNTRLQVEHPITEMVTGIDLVETQLRIAAGEDPGFNPASLGQSGHAIELRIYAEDPVRFLPGGGEITTWKEPVGDGIRVDAGYRRGDVVTTHFDPLMAKLCVWGADRPQALSRARAAVADFEISGPRHNLPFLARVLNEPSFGDGAYDTGLVGNIQRQTATVGA
ncbi:ATP-grasp domain-containing protein [Novosphingobium sp. ERN07]|uniref:acetyl-CoA carboxylase biotin carboxylase subunit n=1 Tax=Novosphingobium sp. ERN07 TaxID=2726187 RepID=UPI0014563C99|nr:biotin carboxylase N-terminal domain-containing protein [Novosphingobium sp. ERN07]NLR73426.1 ATP-grasp domain-containing protein [Novosphingobium sp. ERN07]